MTLVVGVKDAQMRHIHHYTKRCVSISLEEAERQATVTQRIRGRLFQSQLLWAIYTLIALLATGLMQIIAVNILSHTTGAPAHCSYMQRRRHSHTSTKGHLQQWLFFIVGLHHCLHFYRMLSAFIWTACHKIIPLFYLSVSHHQWRISLFMPYAASAQWKITEREK